MVSLVSVVAADHAPKGVVKFTLRADVRARRGWDDRRAMTPQPSPSSSSRRPVVTSASSQRDLVRLSLLLKS
jgi:hypothetical protein